LAANRRDSKPLVAAGQAAVAAAQKIDVDEPSRRDSITSAA
jgi:hypothetical protein